VIDFVNVTGEKFFFCGVQGARLRAMKFLHQLRDKVAREK
jgi:hypothetical protein